MKTHTKIILLIMAVLCLIPASTELFKVVRDFHGERKVIDNKMDESPHEQLKDLLLSKYTNKYIKLAPIMKYDEYKKATLEVELEVYLNKMLQKYVSEINDKLNQNYYLMDYENVIVQEDNNGSVQYIADVFIHDKDLHVVQKLIFDFIVHQDKTVWLNKIIHSNAREPLEHSDNYKDMHGITTNQIIKDNNVLMNGEVSGNKVINLDYTPLKLKNASDKKKLVSEELNGWILNKDVQELTDQGVGSWPCGASSETWDKYGILTNKLPKKPCNGGYNQAYEKRAIQPYSNPVLGEESPNQDGEYSKYFSLDRGIPSFP